MAEKYKEATGEFGKGVIYLTPDELLGYRKLIRPAIYKFNDFLEHETDSEVLKQMMAKKDKLFFRGVEVKPENNPKG